MFDQDEPGNDDQSYYITTAIDYPNAPPHIGHALEKVAADVIARYHRLQGHDTYFSMGLDENSQHVVKAARTNHEDIVAWVGKMNEAFRLAWSKLDISFDGWIRTTEPAHFRASQEMLRRAQENGDIYKSFYTGWYCPNCNAFYTDEELVNGMCPIHTTLRPDWIEEENYFFALSKYSDRLLAYINDHPDFIVPAVWKSEMVGMIRQGLPDFSVSRLTSHIDEAWGVPFPGDPTHVIYVWFDALTNYLTAIGFPDDETKFACYWPAGAHVIGKDITRFHCLYWPAMLMSAGLPLPKQVAVHGFMTHEGQRISKTTGNIVESVALVDEFGVDAVRYYLLRNLSFATDGDFSRSGLVQRYNDELAKDLGNLLNRVVSMVNSYRGGQIPIPGPISELERDLRWIAEETRRLAEAALETWEIGNALNAIWLLVRRTNRYLEQSAPWRLARQPENAAQLDTVLYSAAEAMRLLAIYLAPFIPAASNRIMRQLGLDDVSESAWVREGKWGSRALTSVVTGPFLFPRIDTTDARPVETQCIWHLITEEVEKMPIIEVNNLTKTFKTRERAAGLVGSLRSFVSPQYRQREAVKPICFSLEKGELLAFIGPNGAGKSTTIKMLTGILYPTSGSAQVLGLTPWQQRRNLSFHIASIYGQKSQLWYHLPPQDTFNLLAQIYELDMREYSKRRDFLVEAFDIADYMRTPVRKLSLGERMRCELAASLLHKPSVIFLDEPTIGLDVIAKQRIRDLIGQLNREENVTVFLTSHDAGDIEQVCRRAIVINHGEVILDTPVARLKREYLRVKTVDLLLEEPADTLLKSDAESGEQRLSVQSTTSIHEELLDTTGVRVLKAKGHGLKLEINTARTPLEPVIAAVMQHCHILDMTIADPPMEEIIADIYGQKRDTELVATENVGAQIIAPASEAPSASGG